jgi:hypothetical protein
MQYPDLIDFISTTFQVPIGQNGHAAANPFQDADANTILPRAIDGAEQRIYTDFGDLLTTRQQNATKSCTPGSRTFALPTGCMVVEGLSIITPAATQPSSGTRNDVEPVSLDTIDMMYPTESITGLPKYWAMRDDANVVLGKTPDQAYVGEVTGFFRPSPISSSNISTYISVNYPQLLFMAIAIFWAGYQRDYGAQSDDPKLAVSWKSEYDEAIKVAIMEEKRRKGETIQAGQSSSSPPPPQADPSGA